MFIRCSLVALIAMALFTAAPAAAQIAGEDFDGGALNLNSSVVPALDGGAGDWFGVGNRNAWPQGFPSPGVPFSIGDDSVFGYSNNSPFAGDTEGIFGQNSDLDNNYFAISDSDEFGAQQTASWTFNIAGGTNLALSIDMGGISNASFGGYDLVNTDILFTVQIDAGPVQTAFDVDAVANPGFVTRPMDDGNPSGGGALLQVGGDNAVFKTLADTGLLAGDTFLDKSPASGQGAGLLDTFTTSINGTGTTLVLTLTANMPFEAAVFDNIVITPEPSVAMLLSLGLLGLIRRRR